MKRFLLVFSIHFSSLITFRFKNASFPCRGRSDARIDWRSSKDDLFFGEFVWDADTNFILLPHSIQVIGMVKVVFSAIPFNVGFGPATRLLKAQILHQILENLSAYFKLKSPLLDFKNHFFFYISSHLSHLGKLRLF